MKLPNGVGSVYSLGDGRRKPWIAIKTVGWNENGKQLRKTIGYFAKREDALRALLDYSGADAPATTVTLADLYERWSESKYERLQPSTAAMYKSTWNYFEGIQALPVKDIKKAHIQQIVDAMVEKKKSYSACHKVKVLASLLMKEAMANDLVQKNYAELVELPSSKGKERDYFTAAEIDKIAEAAPADLWANTILILIYTGMRIGELLTLTVANVDLENRVIVGGIKTEAGKNRSIPIHPKILPYIEQWHADKKDRLVHRDGSAIRPDYYREYLYYPLLKRLEIRKVTPHATRHTFASLLNRAKADTKAQQLLLGHADYSTTANIYTHADMEQLRAAIESI